MNDKLQNSIEKQRLAGFKGSEISQNLRNEGYKEEEYIPLILSDLRMEAEEVKQNLELLTESKKEIPTWRVILRVVLFIIIIVRLAVRCNSN